MSLNKRMGDKHEDFCAMILHGNATRGSGNQWHNQLDGKMTRVVSYPYGWDCKSTLKQSISVSRKMWEKAVEQAGGFHPMIPLRFYDTERLDVGLDLAVVNLHDLAELLEIANECECRHGS